MPAGHKHEWKIRVGRLGERPFVDHGGGEIWLLGLWSSMHTDWIKIVDLADLKIAVDRTNSNIWLAWKES